MPRTDVIEEAPAVEVYRGARALREAVHRRSAGSAEGLLERVFTRAFSGLVYPQIWEDPAVDLRALELNAESRVVAIASGGCDVLSYLTADPREIVAVDLNRAHVALTRLKLAAAQHLPDHAAFLRFFGGGVDRGNLAAYRTFIQPHLDPVSRAYWDGRDVSGRRRAGRFARAFYRHGLLGNFIGLSHAIARLYGRDPRRLMTATSLAEQRALFDAELAPLFDKRLVRWATSTRISLFGLGIPPSQYDTLSSAGSSMAAVLKSRLERLACGFPLSENYFAWQAFGRAYAPGGVGPLPPYLEAKGFSAVRERASRVRVANGSLTAHLGGEDAGSFDAYVLLDAQDWMTDAQLNALWAEITRTARPGARVVFRTAAAESVLPGRVDDAILARWHYEAARSRVLESMDRSSIYGGFHLYVFGG